MERIGASKVHFSTPVAEIRTRALAPADAPWTGPRPVAVVSTTGKTFWCNYVVVGTRAAAAGAASLSWPPRAPPRSTHARARTSGLTAMPPMHMTRIHFEPPLPPARRHLQQRSAMGAIIKGIFLFKTGNPDRNGGRMRCC